MMKLLTHIVFFLILEAVYIIFSVIYSREIYILESVLWNSALTLILFCINLMKKRRDKWVFFSVICAIHLVLTILASIAHPLEGDMIYLLGVSAPVNTPFLPRFVFGTGINMVGDVIYYVLFFYGAVLYWYFAYWLSKKIVNSQQYLVS